MFSSPALIAFDSMRIIAALSSLAVVCMTPFAVRRSYNWSQRLRFVGSALLGTAIIGAYLEALGTVPAQWWRTVLITIGVICMLAGIAAYLREDEPIPRGRHGR